MTLDEAIMENDELAETFERRAECYKEITLKHCRKSKQLASWLRELKERRSGGWITCNDRLPEAETMVIVACYGSDIVIPEDGETVEECCKRLQKECVRIKLGFVGSDGWYDSDCYPMIIRPKYWQPLPEPPEIGGMDNG